MGNEHCRRVRDRLPLLAGGDLGVEDRREVERHLIVCLGCRGRRRSFAGALLALHAAASEPPVRPKSPSLWPALSLQIRQSRHRPARPPLVDRLFGPSRVGLGFWPAVGMALGLGGLMVGVVNLSHRNSWSPAFDAPSRARPVVRLEPAQPPALPALPVAPPRPGVLVTNDFTKPGSDRFAAPPSLRVQYDLEYGVPVGPGNRDPQRSY